MAQETLGYMQVKISRGKMVRQSESPLVLLCSSLLSARI